jgi:hypothetical protein
MGPAAHDGPLPLYYTLFIPLLPCLYYPMTNPWPPDTAYYIITARPTMPCSPAAPCRSRPSRLGIVAPCPCSPSCPKVLWLHKNRKMSIQCYLQPPPPVAVVSFWCHLGSPKLYPAISDFLIFSSILQCLISQWLNQNVSSRKAIVRVWRMGLFEALRADCGGRKSMHRQSLSVAVSFAPFYTPSLCPWMLHGVTSPWAVSLGKVLV